MAIEDIERRLVSLADAVRGLPAAERGDLEPLLERSIVALASMRESQALADEQVVRDRLAAARRGG